MLGSGPLGLVGTSYEERLAMQTTTPQNVTNAVQFTFREGVRQILEYSPGLTVRIDEIRAVKAAGNYVEVHTDARRPMLVRSTLAAVEEQLVHDRFVRVHRSTIANLSRVVAVTRKRSGGCSLRFDSGLEISVSRTYAKQVHVVWLRGSV